ncbi:unnamed protein product, partial [Polarella glacialis]
MSSEFYAGQKVEYFSPSYSEWIECKVAAVRPDGKVKLEHIDGTGVLKEAADASRVRAYQGGKPPAAGKAAPGAKAGAAGPPKPKAGAPPGPAAPKKAASPATSPTPGD